MLADTPTTVLEAVNQIIATIGEPPVNSVEDSGVIDAVMALQALSAVNRAVQLKGWHWNTEEDYPIAPSYPEGEIKLPRNALKVDTTGADKSLDLVVRGQRPYELRTHPFEMGLTVTVTMVLLIPFVNLPEATRTHTPLHDDRRTPEGQSGLTRTTHMPL
ncbi:hypothetical protein, partial [Neorhizobium galegae]|uniref:hypothetical protein n=1 Tax=Neorhizobium galegae TaxID=399 RepID=UPI003F6FF28A|nr:hypothetical protein [Neorhizobium galegae]